jgi:hypothetical protein
MATKKRAEGRGRIDFDHLGIGAALSHGRFIVPVNQREYSWEDRHIIALFQDFANAISTNKSSYFLGTIVLTGGEPGAPEIADGQQRLATTTILLAAIRDYLYEKKEERRVTWIETTFLHTILPEANDISPRLSLNWDDNEFFRKRILSRPDSPDRNIQPTKESHKKIARAAELAAVYIQDILRPLSESNKVPYLIQWAQFIENTAQVILLKVPGDLDAFVMFETLNDRGLNVSQSDLVKNYLFGEATDEKIVEAQNKWAKMSGALETLDMEGITLSYMRHLLSSIHGLTPERDIFERIKNTVAGSGAAITFLDILAEHANDYVAILNPDHPKWNSYSPNVRNYIRTMNDLQAVPLRHLMLAVARQFTPREAEKAFRLFIAWAVRFLITGGGRGGTLEGAYADKAREITKGRLTTTKRLAEEMASIVPSDLQFESEFAIAQVPKSKLARYFLRALELKVKGNPEPEFVPNEETVITLEHILPQNPGSGWKIDLETARTYYRRLGNMVLLQASRNIAIGNRKFSDKVAVFKSSAYILTSKVAEHSTWGVEEIIERQKMLASLAVKTWPLDVR